MYVLLCFAAVTVLYGLLSWLTYSQTMRNTWLVFPVTWSLTIAATTIWILLVRHLSDTRRIVAASLIWDLIITVMYSALPLLLVEKKVSVQALICLAVAVAAIVAFKFYS
jgi:hypothetical protein